MLRGWVGHLAARSEWRQRGAALPGFPVWVTVEQVATGRRPLLDKPMEFVLPTQGEPADRAALEPCHVGCNGAVTGPGVEP
jgi:hypothetical protein